MNIEKLKEYIKQRILHFEILLKSDFATLELIGKKLFAEEILNKIREK